MKKEESGLSLIRFTIFSFLFIFYFFISVVFVSANPHRLNIWDSYYNSETFSSSDDKVGFVGEDFEFNSVSFGSGPNLVCYDFDYFQGGEDDNQCIYTSTTNRDACISCFSLDQPMIQKSSLMSTISGEVCPGCNVNTNNNFGDEAVSEVYYNCNTCGSATAEAEADRYYVIRYREFYCANDGDDKFVVRGNYADKQDNKHEWIEYNSFSCSRLFNNEYGCSTRLDGLTRDYNGYSSMNWPCLKKDGFSCFQNSECVSFRCDGKREQLNLSCDYDGSDQYTLDTRFYDNSCGGEGLFFDNITIRDVCSSIGSSNYVCDSDFISNSILDDSAQLNEFCKLKEYSSCTSNNECWNDNGGYDCIGSSGNTICTTGENGKNCYNNDNYQCNSFRCDTTCQSKLLNGQSCDENTDCMNGTCSDGICGGTQVNIDLAVIDIIPVQVIKDVDLVKGKSGVVRIVVTNYGLNLSKGLVNVTFDGVQLNISNGDNQTKDIPPNGKNITFDFDFLPLNSGDNKQFIANVTVV